MKYITVKSILDYVDELKLNNFSRSTKLMWLNEIEYRVQTDVMLFAAESVATVPDDDNYELLVPAPFYEIYYDYLFMKISEHVEESAEQNNRSATFDKAFTRFMRWWADTYHPADGNAVFKGYYVMGPEGPAGSTPRRGIEYWTPADVADIERYLETMNAHYEGEYSDETEYGLNAVVEFDDNVYWHKTKATTTGVDPTDETVWAIVLKPSAVSIDRTLTQEDKAADAKATGDAINEVDAKADAVDEKVDAINARTNIPAPLSEEGCIAMGNVMMSYYAQAHPASGSPNLVYPNEGWRNLFLEDYKHENVNAIQCSGFSGAIINAIPFENSRYNGWDHNIPLPFGYAWDATAHSTPEYPDKPDGAHPGEVNLVSKNQKLYALEHGFLWDASNLHIQPACGDLIFQENSSGDVGHVGMVLYASDIRAANAKVRVIEAWPDEGIRQHTYDRDEIDYYARLPLGYTAGRNALVYRNDEPISNSVSGHVSVKILDASELAKVSAGDIITWRMRATVAYKSGKSAQTGYNFSVRIEYSDDTSSTVWMEQLGEFYYCSYFISPGASITAIKLMARGDEQITGYTADDIRCDIGLCPIPLA